MFNWLEAAQRILTQGKCFCLISITDTHGSTPRSIGAKMLVTKAASYGSIGGGNLENQAILKARLMLKTMSGPQEMDSILGPDMEQCCGGRVTMKLEIVQNMDAIKGVQDSTQTPLYLFGAGHVGTALMAAIGPLPFDVRLFDNRPEKNAAPINSVKSVVSAAPKKALFLVMTHDHALDYELVCAILSRKLMGYCGMIGSKTKRARFLSKLRKDGLTEEQLSRLTCPIGIDGIQGKEPEIIAASVAAQLLLQLGEPHEH